MELHIGVDDFDSPLGMCTTYFGALIIDYIKEKKQVYFLDYPYLIRLNPNIPFKTRGNGAISLHLEINEGYVDDFIDFLIKGIEEYAELKHGKSDPVIVVKYGGITNELRKVYQRALRELIPSKYVFRILKDREDIKIIYYKKGRGIVGAVSAIGSYKLKNFTYELLIYRNIYDRTKERKVDIDVLYEIDKKYRPLVFANFDYTKKRLLAVSHGPDPVILGIRSYDPCVLTNILSILFKKISFEKAVIYKSNQGTNAHLSIIKKIKDIRPYDSVIVKGIVIEKPKIIRGGHVIFNLKDDTGSITCSVYKQTGRLNRLAKLLHKGDFIEVGGGIIPFKSYGNTLNVEYIRFIYAKPIESYLNPLCPRCGSRMKSMGRNKGFKCPKCGYKNSEIRKIKKIFPRYIDLGLYTQSPIAYRHLTKPFETYGMYGTDYDSTIVSPLIFS